MHSYSNCSFIFDSYSINLCLGYQLCLICPLIPLYFFKHLHRHPGIFLPNVWTLPSESCLPFCLEQEYNYLCGQGGDVTVRNTPSKGEHDDSPETSHFFIQTTSGLYTQFELHEFIEHIRNTVAHRIENSQDQLQGSGWALRELLECEITLCNFAKGVLGSFREFPSSLRGSRYIFNPRTSQNCLLTAIASFRMFKLRPRMDNRYLQTKIKLNPRKFWTDRDAIGSLNSDSIGWEALSELEKLNKISFVIYRLG